MSWEKQERYGCQVNHSGEVITSDQQPPLLLVKGGHVYTPQDQGELDILTCDERILKIAPRIDPPPGIAVKIVDARKKLVIPGLIDLHVHLLGGGGEGGFGTRMPEISLKTILEAGVTSVVGCLGTDDVTRRLESLLAKALQLRDEGISAYIYTGSYHVPPPTITGSIRKDIALIDPIVGVGELAISDHRCSQPTFEEFVRIAAEARTGGMIGGKAGLVHLHVGNGEKRLSLLIKTVKETEIPIGQFLPTHVNRTAELFEHALEFARMGGNIDLTAGSAALAFGLDTTSALEMISKENINLDQITLSSDSNGSMPIFNSRGQLVRLAVGQISVLPKALRSLHASGMPLDQALCPFTANPASRLGLARRKGRLEPGMDADIILLDSTNLEIDTVIARGKLMLPV